MSLFLELPDDLVLNYVLLFIGNVNEILTLRLVSKSFNEKVEILLLAIIELDLTALESLKAEKLFSDHKVVLEDFEDIKKMQVFRLKTLSFSKELDEFDYYVGQGLLNLSRNSLEDFSLEEVSCFLKYSMDQELKSVFSMQISHQVYEKANQMCLFALNTIANIDGKQRKLLNWLTGALKMCQIFFSIEPNFSELLAIKAKHDFYTQRVNQISQYFGMFQQIK